MTNIKESIILVVDDDVQMCESIHVMLNSVGYQVQTKTNLREAIFSVSNSEHAFDLIILDLKLDDHCGFDLIDHLKQNEINSQIIIITGQHSENKVIKSFKRGVVDYLKKPFEPDVFIDAVNKALELRKKNLEKRQLDLAIASSRNRYRDVIDSQNIYLCRINLNFDITFVNKTYSDYLKGNPRQAIGKQFMSLHDASIQRSVLNQLLSVKSSGESATAEYKISDPRGKCRYQQWHFQAINNNRGELSEIQCVGCDVTISKIHSEEIEAKKEKYRQLAEITSDLLWEVNKDGYYTYVSPIVFNLLGYWPEEVIGKKPFDFMESGEAKRIEEIFKSAFREGHLLRSVENVNVHKNGYRITLETNGVPILDKNGFVIGYRGIDRDITERKIVEKKLEEEKDKLEKALKKVKQLSGLLPICASCKKIRDDKGYWKQIEAYITEHSEVEFSHSICPECAKKLYPEYYDENVDDH